MADLAMRILVSLQDQASAGLAVLQRSLTGAALAVGAVGLAAVGTSVKMAADFQQAMLKNVALAGLSQQQYQQMSEAILNLAPQVGQAPKDLAEGLYYVLSAGIPASQAISTLQYSAELAASGLTSMTTTSAGLTTVMKTFGLSAKDAADIITRTVANGKMTMEQYATSIGKLSLQARSANRSVYETNAALDVLTNNGFPSAARASTALSQLFTQMDIKTDTLAQHARKLGLSFDEQRFKSLSLAGQLDYLRQITGGNSEELLKLLGGSTLALQAFQALSGHSQEYAQQLQSVQQATQGAGATSKAFAATQQGFNQQLAQAKAALDAVAIRIGMQLLPYVTDLLKTVTPLISKLADWIEKNHVVERAIGAVKTAVNDVKTGIDKAREALQTANQWWQQHHDQIMSVATAITLFFLPALTKAGAEAVTAGVKLGASFVANVIRSGTEAVTAGVKLGASFVANIIKSGIEGWTAAGKLAVYIGQIIASGVQAVIAGVKMAASFIANVIRAGIQATITGAQMMASLIPALISLAVQGVASAVAALPGLIAGFIGWAGAAGAAAVATIAATWPLLLVAAIVVAVVAVIVVAVTHWGQISQWLQQQWQRFQSWLQGFWKQVQNGWNAFLGAVKGILQGALMGIFMVFIGPYVMVWSWAVGWWNQLQGKWKGGLGSVLGILTGMKQTLYNAFVAPFVDAWNWIAGLPGRIGGIFDQIKNSGFGQALHAMHVPGFAGGVKNFAGGFAVVGERGPELVYLPPGSSVYPQVSSSSSSLSPSLARGSTGGASVVGGSRMLQINLTFHVSGITDPRRFSDLVLDELSRRLRRQGNLITTTSGGRSV